MATMTGLMSPVASYAKDTPASARGFNWKNANPYFKEGIRDYYSGLCYRARPYADLEDSHKPDDLEKTTSWEEGFLQAEIKDHNRFNRSHCRAVGDDEIERMGGK